MTDELQRNNCYVLVQVNARWLLDLDKFNEWMNEEDYEMTETDSDVSQSFSLAHLISAATAL